MSKIDKENFLTLMLDYEQSLLLNNNVQIKFPKSITELTDDDVKSYPCDRLDLRHEIVFPIDCDNTKDRDDALSMSYDGIRHLGIHIADVASRVRAHSELDEVAKQRGTSIYSPTGDVIPMMPDILSQHLCSLNCADRNTISTLIDIDSEGNILNFKIVKSIIRPLLLGVYSEINAFLDGSAGQAIKEKYQPIGESLYQLKLLAAILRKRRREQGAEISIDKKQPKISIIDNKAVISPPEDGVAQQIVEECMILANACNTKFFKEHNLPSIFRVQDELNNYAYYCCDHSWHTSLAVDYAHTTSPIRRYPDLINQRILSAFLLGASAESLHYIFDSELEEIAEIATRRFRRAKDIQRAIERFAYKEFLRLQNQPEYSGVICGLSHNRTAFIRLDTLNLCIPSRWFITKNAIGRRVLFNITCDCIGSPYRAYNIRIA